MNKNIDGMEKEVLCSWPMIAFLLFLIALTALGLVEWRKMICLAEQWGLGYCNWLSWVGVIKLIILWCLCIRKNKPDLEKKVPYVVMMCGYYWHVSWESNNDYFSF